jgi:D-3-phosphoglycerate dehydrogenase
MKNFTRALLSLGLLAGVAAPAIAADYTPEAVVTASGLYLRGDAGWSWLGTDEDDDSVLVLGGGLGYQFNDNLRTDLRVDFVPKRAGQPDAVDALKDLLDSGHIAGAALDVFETEPAKESPLFGTPNFICTPHLGASTTEAQVNVALQVAEQMAEFLTTGGVTNALNMPSLSAEEAPKLKPYMALAERLGSLVGQLAHDNLTKINIEVEGAAAQLNQKPITGAVLAGLMKQYSQTVNMVNAPFLAKERGLDVREVRHDREGYYHTLVRVTVSTAQGDRSVAGTLFANGQPRLVEIFGNSIEADLDGDMLYISNNDAPGFIGSIGTVLGKAGINIGTFHLGRREAGGEAVLLLSVDSPVPEDVLAQARLVPGVRTVRALKF